MVHDLEDLEPSECEDGSRLGWLSAQLHGSGEGQVEPAGSPRTQDLNPCSLSKRAAMIEACSGRQQALLQAQLVPGSLSPSFTSIFHVEKCGANHGVRSYAVKFIVCRSLGLPHRLVTGALRPIRPIATSWSAKPVCGPFRHRRLLLANVYPDRVLPLVDH